MATLTNKDISLNEALNRLPNGCIFITQGGNQINQLIGLWYCLKNPLWAIKTGFKFLCCHAGVYLGGPGRLVVESMPYKILGKIPFGYIGEHGFEESSLNDHNIVWVYTNKNMTATQYQMLKAFSKGACGRLYDIFANIHFVTPNVSEEPAFFMCSEFTTAAFRNADALAREVSSDSPDINPVPSLKPSDVHPTALFNYFEQPEGMNAGWKRVFWWNKGEFELYE